MPEILIHGARIHYEEQGDGLETILFAHGFLWSGRMFDDQVNALKDRYRCITFDFRGQGHSEVTKSGCDVESLTQDVIELIAALDCEPCHFAGLSMGGFVGLRIAIQRPELLKSLILMETSADPEPEERIGQYRLLGFIARWFGMRPVADRVMAIMFGETFLNNPARGKIKEMWRERLIAVDRIGATRTLNGVIYREGVYDQIDRISAPTLIVVGDKDIATAAAKSERMHARIPNSKLVVIADAGHTSTVEEPEAVNAAMIDFLDGLSA